MVHFLVSQMSGWNSPTLPENLGCEKNRYQMALDPTKSPHYQDRQVQQQRTGEPGVSEYLSMDVAFPCVLPRFFQRKMIYKDRNPNSNPHTLKPP